LFASGVESNSVRLNRRLSIAADDGRRMV